MKNILVDARALQDSNYKGRGIGSHCKSLLDSILKFLPDITLHALVDKTFPALDEEHQAYFSKKTYDLRAPVIAEDFDLFLELSAFTHTSEPLAKILKSSIAKIVLIYDFIPLDFRPEIYHDTPEKKLGYLNSLFLMLKYDRFYAISKYSKERLAFHGGVDPGTIEVTGVALRETLVAAQNRKHSSSSLNGKDYFIAVLGEEMRKNPDIVVEAFARFSKEVDSNFELRIVGRYSDGGKTAIKNKFASINGSESSLIFVGHCSEEELYELYASSLASISPSFVEGFSIPVIEAAFAGTLVLASDCDAHTELLNDKDLVFNPSNSDGLFQLMKKSFVDKAWRAEKIKNTSNIAPSFFEEKIGRAFCESIVKVFDDKRKSLGKTEKPCIAFLTPYPPDRSGIADFSYQTIQHFKKFCDVDVYAPFVEKYHTLDGVNVYPLSKYPFYFEKYDRVLSAVGNSHFHTDIINLIKEFGGHVIVHDNRLVELYFWWLGPADFCVLASKIIGRIVTEEEATGWIRDVNTVPTLFFEEIIASTDRLVCHSKPLIQQLKKMYGVEPSYLPFSIYRDVELRQASSHDVAEIRQIMKIDSKALVVSTFGIVDKLKSFEEIIQAIQILTMRGMNCFLLFAGECGSNLGRVLLLAKELGIENRIITCDGWISEQDYRKYLVITDVAVQLRTHRFGGLSGAVLDCISSGIPLVCNTDLGKAVEVPEFVTLIPDEYTPLDIAEGIVAATKYVGRQQEIAIQVKAFKAVHNFDVYAEKLIDFLELKDVQR